MWSGDGLLVTDCYIFGYKTGCIFRLVVYGVGANDSFCQVIQEGVWSSGSKFDYWLKGWHTGNV